MTPTSWKYSTLRSTKVTNIIQVRLITDESPIIGVTKAQMQVRLLEEENEHRDVSGQSTVIAEGLKLEEDQ